MQLIKSALLAGAVVILTGCSTIKYNALEKIGIHKRDVLISNVEDTRDAQQDAQEQFRDALDRFSSIVELKDTDLKQAYENLNDEYEDSRDAAQNVSRRIAEVEEVAIDLFTEWREEIETYTDAVLRRDSERSLRDTESRYTEMVKSMRRSESTMQPVLATLYDNVLYLKHNLNAQAVGSLRVTFNELKGDIDILMERMNQSIARSDDFIKQMR